MAYEEKIKKNEIKNTKKNKLQIKNMLKLQKIMKFTFEQSARDHNLLLCNVAPIF